MFDNLRSYVDELGSQEELVKVEAKVDWNLEVGAITRRAIDLRAPAPHFLNVKGYPKGYSILGSLFGPTEPYPQGRLSIALGLERDTPPLEVIDEFRRRIRTPKKPINASEGPTQEKVVRGNDVNLLKFPAPLIHRGDGGRYLGTWSICITKDPDTDWVNWGVYRCMVHDRRTLGILLHPSGQHGGFMYYQKYEPSNEPMPIAIAIGADPISTLAASTSFPSGVNHVDMAGALMKQGARLVKCQSSDLYVPASSEIVIEGFVPPRKRKAEGPFGEYTGYMSGGRSNQPYVEVDTITHRDDPILPMANMGKLWDECAVVNSIAESAVAAEVLSNNKVNVKSVYYMPPKTIIVSADGPSNLARRISNTLWGSGCRTAGEYVLVVGEDVDITDLEDVWWCMTTRLHPVRGIRAYRSKGMDPLVPMWSPEERESRTGVKAVLDARFPEEWGPEYTREHTSVVDFEAWPRNVREKVSRRWKEYGYK